jgi:hypothetical protein
MSEYPPIWRLLMDTWDIPAPLDRQWWQALKAAKWSKTVTWKEEVLLAQTWGRAEDLGEKVWTPRRCVDALEGLVQEGCLSRRKANKIVELLLISVGPTGQWK